MATERSKNGSVRPLIVILLLLLAEVLVDRIIPSQSRKAEARHAPVVIVNSPAPAQPNE